MQYIRIKLEGGGSYISPDTPEALGMYIQGELDGAEFNQTITLHLTPVEMTEAEFEALKEFEGH